jgi:NTP pyrophosphatase (non-canonical NTP hydrolase)
MKTYKELEMLCIQWGEARGIVQNSTPMAQAMKTFEEVDELYAAINKHDRDEMKDAYGDILVTLIMGCATADIDLAECLELAYNEIKDRKGSLNTDGIWVKE